MNSIFGTEWQTWLKDLRSHRQSWRQWCCVLFAAILAIGFGAACPMVEAPWITLSALLGLYVSARLLMPRNLLLLFMASFLIGLLALVTNTLASVSLALAGFLFVLVFLLLYWGVRYDVLWAATFVACFYAILSAGLPTTGEGGLQRFYCIVLGFSIAIAVQLVMTHGRLVMALRYALASSLMRLGRLCHAIFQCYIVRYDADKQYDYEKILHQCRADVLFDLQHARVLLSQLTAVQRETYQVLVDYVEQMYEIIQSLGLMAQRVEDHATFEVAQKEFSLIAAILAQRFRQLANCMVRKQPEPESVSTLSEAIYELEEVNRSVLQVVAREPLAFVIFIQDLYALDRICLRLTDVMTMEGEP